MSSQHARWILDPEDLKHAIARAENMLTRWGEDDNVVFSSKMRMWTKENDPILHGLQTTSMYHISIHFMTRKGVDMVLLKDIPDLSSTDDLVSMQFVDYREAPPTRQDFQRCFSGVPIAISIETREHCGSYEREISSFVVHDGHFYPGMLHNMFLPAFDVRWGGLQIAKIG